MTRFAPLSRFLSGIAQGMPTQRYEVAEGARGERYPLVQARQMDNLYVHGGLPTVELAGERLERFVLAPNTVLVAIRTWPMKASVLAEDAGRAVAGQNIAVLTLRPDLDPVYLAGLLRSDFMTEYLGMRQAASGQPMLSLKQLQSMKIPTPPLETQQALAQLFLERERADMLAIRSTAQRHRVVEAALSKLLAP